MLTICYRRGSRNIRQGVQLSEKEEKKRREGCGGSFPSAKCGSNRLSRQLLTYTRTSVFSVGHGILYN